MQHVKILGKWYYIKWNDSQRQLWSLRCSKRPQHDGYQEQGRPHITSTLRSFHLLFMNFQVLIITYEILHGLGGTYLHLFICFTTNSFIYMNKAFWRYCPVVCKVGIPKHLQWIPFSEITYLIRSAIYPHYYYSTECFLRTHCHNF